MADPILKTHSYRMYRNGIYLGALQNVTSEFNYEWDINSAFVQTTVEIGLTPDTAGQEVEPLYDETGAILLDENGQTLYPERNPDLFGNENENALVRDGNQIKIYEYSTYNPNGILKFDGIVEAWRALYGDENKLSIFCLSNGADFNDYILQTGGYTLEVNQSTGTGATLVRIASDDPGNYTLGGQSFIPATSYDLGKIRVKLYWDITSGLLGHGLKLSVYAGTPGYTELTGSPIATATIDDQDQTIHWAEFILSTPVAVTSGSNYYFTVQTTQLHSEYYLVDTTPSAYASGQEYDGQEGYAYTGYPTYDLTFQIYSSNNATVSTFTSTDPTTILTQAIDNYRGQGGAINYDGTSTELTGVSVDYTFKLATILEAVKKCLELAPSDWYWSVDPGSGIISFKQTNTTADHKFLLGRHINRLELVSTAENVRNYVYFSGGDTGGGINLFSLYINQDSIDATGRRRLERMSDNRVTVQATADQLASNLLDERAAEEYQSPLTILDGTYDIDSINVGDTVGFGNFGNFIDRLILQVAHITYYPDRVDLLLGKLPVRQTDQVRNAIADVNKLQTIDNPSSPS